HVTGVQTCALPIFVAAAYEQHLVVANVADELVAVGEVVDRNAGRKIRSADALRHVALPRSCRRICPVCPDCAELQPTRISTRRTAEPQPPETRSMRLFTALRLVPDRSRSHRIRLGVAQPSLEK